METFRAADPRPRPRYRIEHRTAAGTAELSRHPEDFEGLTASLAAEGAGGVLVVASVDIGRHRSRQGDPGPRPPASTGRFVPALRDGDPDAPGAASPV